MKRVWFNSKQHVIVVEDIKVHIFKGVCAFAQIVIAMISLFPNYVSKGLDSLSLHVSLF